ncbi:MAG: hypothetical protein EBV38_04030 [Burkholderiaceae bacterium]|nr:hypothetical protein [Burkholderiaceae bacterium]
MPEGRTLTIFGGADMLFGNSCNENLALEGTSATIRKIKTGYETGYEMDTAITQAVYLEGL